MVNALLIESTGSYLHCLESMILKACPDINISYKVDSLSKAFKLPVEKSPELVFIDIDNLKEDDYKLVDNFLSDEYEVILITKTSAQAIEVIKHGAAGYIVKPVKRDELAFMVSHAIQKIKRKEEETRNKFLSDLMARMNGNGQILGIPTLEGFEFIHISEIIRCEGLQKCTRIITTEKSDMISSYNLGEFRRILEPHGFFSPHKSHLINLKYIRKYNREGSITMNNGTYVPVSKRRKKDFLDQFTHF